MQTATHFDDSKFIKFKTVDVFNSHHDIYKFITLFDIINLIQLPLVYQTDNYLSYPASDKSDI